MHEGKAPVGLIVAAWAVSGAADQAMRRLERSGRQRRAGIIDAVVLVIDADGAARVKGTGDVAAGQGAVLGGVLGAALGLLISGPGWLQLGGGMISVLAARACEGGLAGGWLRVLGERLAPHASAIVAAVEHRQAGRWSATLPRWGPMSSPKRSAQSRSCGSARLRLSCTAEDRWTAM